MSPYRIAQPPCAETSLPKPRSFKDLVCKIRGKHWFTKHRFGKQQFLSFPECNWLGETKRMRYDICKICGTEIEFGFEPIPLVIGFFTTERCAVCKKDIPIYNGQPFHDAVSHVEVCYDYNS